MKVEKTQFDLYLTYKAQNIVFKILIMKGQILQLCLNCTEKFRKNPLCEEFRNPVTIPNYRSIIKNPMDLTFIYEHLNEREYYKNGHAIFDLYSITQWSSMDQMTQYTP